MRKSSVFAPPPPWRNQPLRLYHGTSASNAEEIVARGVRIATGRELTDFGPGFYTTTFERQARSWAWNLTSRGHRRPAVVCGDVEREALAALDVLVFVRGDFDADDFWSMVVHCRTGAADHARLLPEKPWYDVVAGPVAASWRQRMPMTSADQISFHTPEAEAVLNSVRWRILR